MLPTSHFLITAAATVPVALASGQGAAAAAGTAAIAGVVSAAVDLDVYAFVLVGARRDERLRPFRSMLGIYRHFPRFMESIAATGILRKAMVTHHLICASLCVAGALIPAWRLPLLLAAGTHWASDVPNIVRVVRRRRQ